MKILTLLRGLVELMVNQLKGVKLGWRGIKGRQNVRYTSWSCLGFEYTLLTCNELAKCFFQSPSG